LLGAVELEDSLAEKNASKFLNVLDYRQTKLLRTAQSLAIGII